MLWEELAIHEVENKYGQKTNEFNRLPSSIFIKSNHSEQSHLHCFVFVHNRQHGSCAAPLSRGKFMACAEIMVGQSTKMDLGSQCAKYIYSIVVFFSWVGGRPHTLKLLKYSPC